MHAALTISHSIINPQESASVLAMFREAAEVRVCMCFGDRCLRIAVLSCSFCIICLQKEKVKVAFSAQSNKKAMDKGFHSASGAGMKAGGRGRGRGRGRGKK